MIDIHLFETLVAFDEYGTLSKAAEKMLISQPALSRSMQKLEEEMGVPLFERQKNKLTLNDNGKLTVKYARELLEQEKELIEKVRAFDAKNRSISFGSCAPMPLESLNKLLSELYPEIRITSQLLNDDQVLIDGLLNDTYQLVILHHKREEKDIFVKEYKKENLYISVPPAHPLAGRDSVSLEDLDGQDILIFNDIGFWMDLCIEKMPHTHFLRQSEYDTFGILANSSALPHFSSDRAGGLSRNRVNIPLSNPECQVTYYIACRRKDCHYFDALWNAV